MQVLLICDDYWHPGQVPIDGLAPLGEKGFQFDIVTDLKDFSTDMLSKYPVVVLSKCDQKSPEDKSSWKTDEVQQAFIDYVEKGGGLIVAHTGLVPGKATEALDRLIGSKFTYHPQDCPVTVQAIKPHPITEGVELFCEVDEHYRLEILSDDVDIIMASYSPPQGEESKYKDEPYHNSQAWIGAAVHVRTQGKGCVCVLTPGHHLAVWHNPQYQRVLENTLRWCSQSD